MKTITNNKRRVKHSLKHRAQRNHKTHKNKHTKTQLKQHKTHRGGSFRRAEHDAQFNQTDISITSQNIDDFIKAYAYTNSIESHNNVLCTSIAFNDINDTTLINNSINIITTQFNVLETLVIVGCKITVLPESIGNLTALTTLNVNDCPGLTSIPESIGQLSALTTLYVNDCPGLTSIPESIGNLTQLKTLSLDNCTNLTVLPESIGNLTALTTLDFR